MRNQRKTYCKFWDDDKERYSRVARLLDPFYIEEGLVEYESWVRVVTRMHHEIPDDFDASWYEYYHEGGYEQYEQYAAAKKKFPDAAPELVPTLMRMFS